MGTGKYRLRTTDRYLEDAAAHHKIQKRRRESSLEKFFLKFRVGMYAGCPTLDLCIDAPQYMQDSRDLNWQI